MLIDEIVYVRRTHSSQGNTNPFKLLFLQTKIQFHRIFLGQFLLLVAVIVVVVIETIQSNQANSKQNLKEEQQQQITNKTKRINMRENEREKSL